MSDRQVIIMAQGHQRRLADLRHPKHLLPVDGEPILTRTLRLLDELEVDAPVLIIGPAALQDAVPGIRRYHPGIVAQVSRPGSCIVTGIKAALELPLVDPRRPTHVLLGDVVWSKAALGQVMADRRPLAFAGTPVLTSSLGEVFATLFDDPQGVKGLCETCPCVKPRWQQMQGGHLRRLLWHAMATRRVAFRHRGTAWWDEDVYLPIADWTTDIDKPADVARLPELTEHARLEAGKGASGAPRPAPRATSSAPAHTRPNRTSRARS